MKTILLSLRVGQKVWATVDEVLDGRDLIVNFEGDLLRVGNRSDRNFRPGQRIQLNVESVSPLEFKLVEARRIQMGLNIEI